MKRLIILAATALFITLKGFSQKIIFIDPDTLICFTQTESKFLLLSYYKGEEASKLLNNCEEVSKINLNLLKEYRSALDNRNKTILLKDTLISEQKTKISETENKLDKEKKKSKFLKSVVFIVSGILIAESGFIYFKK